MCKEVVSTGEQLCTCKKEWSRTHLRTTPVCCGVCWSVITMHTCESFISPWTSRLTNLSHKCCIHVSHIEGLLSKGAWGGRGAGQSSTVVSRCPPKLETALTVCRPTCVKVSEPIFGPPRSSGPHNVLITVRSDGLVQSGIYVYMNTILHAQLVMVIMLIACAVRTQ